MPALIAGREIELGALAAELRAATSGRGGVVTVAGEPGVGKTALVSSFADDAARAGARVLWSGGPARSASTRGHPWTSFARELGDESLEDRLGMETIGTRTYEDLAGLLARAAAEHPLVIVVDDADALDAIALDALTFVGAQAHVRRLLVVATLTASSDRIPHADTKVFLRGLGRDAVAHILRDRGVHATAAVATVVQGLADGNPADVIRLAARLRTRPSIDDCHDAALAEARSASNRGGAREAERWVQRAIVTIPPGDRLGQVALLAHEMGATTSVTHDDRFLLLERASDGVTDETLRARVLAALARDASHLDSARQLGPAVARADEALAIARKTGDRQAIAFCLIAKHDAEWQPGSARRRLALLNESVELDPTPEAVLARAVAYLELGDARAAREFDRFVQAAGADGSARAQYLSCSRRAMRALMAGDLPTAEALIDEGARLARRFGEPDGAVVALNQRVELALERGDVSPLLAALERARELSSHPSIVASLALARLDNGDRAGATAAVAPYADVALDLVKPEYGRAWAASMLAEVFARLDHVDAVERCVSQLAPLAGLNLVVGGGVVFHGSVDHHVGVALARLGHGAQARSHLLAAMAAHERLGAQRWAARTGELLARDARSGSAASPATPIARAAMSFDGSVWVIDYGGVTVAVRDSKGLHDLAHLVTVPGEAVPAAALAGRTEEARFGSAPVLDEVARRAYRERIAATEREIERADGAGDANASARAAAIRSTLVTELANATGLGGRTRRLGDPNERARKAVSARVRDAIRHLDARHPLLAAHLRDSVVTGMQCAYRPATPIAWDVRQTRSGR